MVAGDPCFEYASPIQAPQFFIGRESQKDVWVTSLDQRKKILVTNMVKEEFKDIELHDGGGLNLIGHMGYPVVKKN